MTRDTVGTIIGKLGLVSGTTTRQYEYLFVNPCPSNPWPGSMGGQMTVYEQLAKDPSSVTRSRTSVSDWESLSIYYSFIWLMTRTITVQPFSPSFSFCWSLLPSSFPDLLTRMFQSLLERILILKIFCQNNSVLIVFYLTCINFTCHTTQNCLHIWELWYRY